MSNTDLRICALNGLTMALSFSNIESALKIVLLVASIFYTTLKIVETIKKKYNDNKGDNI
jgi:hypothetical protein